MTDSLYYRDPLQREFEAHLIAIDEERLRLTLDTTAFYPEGGGQPADVGEIAGAAVADVQKDESGTIVHHLERPLDGSLRIGDSVTGTVEWGHRWDYMQQHSGQHLLSGALMRIAAAPTVSVHQGSDLTTIEVDRESLSDAELAKVDDLANEIIAADRSIITRWIDDSELHTVALRRPTGRRGRIRLVEIEGFDLVACGGVHLPRTALLNVVQIVSVERIRGRLRLAYKIGDRAITDYREKHHSISAVAELFSARPDQTPGRVSALIDEIKEKNGVLRRRAERIADAAIAALHVDSRPQSLILTGEDEDIFRAIAERSTTDETRRLVVCNLGRDRIDWAIVVGARHPFPADVLRRELLAPLGAKGGGKPPLWRGVIPQTDAATARRFVETACALLEDHAP